MKKASYLLICIISLITFSGCQLDDIFAPKPSVKFVAGDGLYTQNSIVSPNDTLCFKIEVAPNDTDGTALKNYSFIIYDLNHSSTEPVYENSKTFGTNDFDTHVFNEVYTPAAPAYLKITAKATDVNNTANEIQFIIDVLEPGIRLGWYEGTTTALGTLHSDFAFLDSVDMTTPIHTETIVDSIPGKDRLNVTFVFDGFPVTVEGKRNGNILEFDEFSFNLTVNHVEDIDLVFLANLTTLFHTSDHSLEITGNLSGTGHTAGNTNMTEVEWTNGHLTGSLQEQDAR